MQHTAITTILDLINLTQSVTHENENVSCDQDVKDIPQQAARIVSVVIVPSLSQQHLHYLHKQTTFYKVKNVLLIQLI